MGSIAQAILQPAWNRGFISVNPLTRNVSIKHSLNYCTLDFETYSSNSFRSRSSVFKKSAKLFTQVFKDYQQNEAALYQGGVKMNIAPEDSVVIREWNNCILHPWIIGTEEQKNVVKMQLWSTNSKENKPFDIKRFVTGGCLFASMLKGIDQYGLSHPLTDRSYRFPDSTLITNIEVNDNLHPYEIMMFKQLDTLSTLMKSINPDCSVHYHLPKEEYLLMGLDMYLQNQMSKKALISYSKAVLKRSQQHRQMLKRISNKHDISITDTSPLRGIFADFQSEEDIVQSFFENIKLSSKEAGNLVLDPRQSSLVYDKVLQSLLSEQTNGESAIMWRDIVQKRMRDQLPELNEINHNSYALMVAEVAAKGNPNETGIIDDIGEKAIAKEYSKHFSDKYGPVACFHWLPNFFIDLHQSTNKRNSLFHMNVDDHEEEFNSLFEDGIFDYCRDIMVQVYDK